MTTYQNDDGGALGWALAGLAALGLGVGVVLALKKSGARVNSFDDGEGSEGFGGGEPCEMRGEWWIDDSGFAMFADGDIGGMNHEGYVIDRVNRQILYHLGIDADDSGEGVEGVFEHEEELDEILGETENYEELYKALDAQLVTLWPDAQQRKDALSVVRGGLDARVYGLKWDGWKRVKGTEIETWTLTPDDLSAIARGLGDTGDEIENCKFNIEVRSTGKYYVDVPLDVIDKGRISALREYLNL